MKTISEKIAEVSKYIHLLSMPEYSVDVKAAVEKSDKKALMFLCKKAKVPSTYASTVCSVILSVDPMKWPAAY
jgi:hypothetical protein